LSTVEPRRLIRSGMAASAIAHLSLLTVVLIFAEVHPFGAVTAETIAVDIVTPQEVTPPPKEEEPPPKPQPSDAFELSAKSAASSAPPPPARQQAAAPLPKQAPPPTPRPAQQQMAALPQPSISAATAARQESTAQPQPPSTSPSPVIAAPEPDLSVKYHVLLGLPPDLPQDRPGDGFDAPASAAAGVATSLVAQFKSHLKTCSKLPESIAASDPIKIKLRVFMTPDGKLATDPVLIEASASIKGPALMQGAINALQACQPYAMLPADKYGEWKVLDLSFTPQDFAGG
jgi:type IV secretory pathway VirB10-like protein